MAQAQAQAQAKAPTSAAELFQALTDAYESVKKQLGNGITQPVLPLNKTLLLGSEGLAVLQKHLEESCAVEIAVTLDASSNSLFVTPLAPMGTPTKAAKTTKAKTATAKDSGDKVPRPSNAFILYRKDWHPRVVAENPGLHNNQISVILGKQWRNESDAVRAAYKQKAEEAKHQHELAHPDYQYQPRKPSEKKRRMTKNKIAKLAKAQAESGSAVQQPLPDDFDPVTLLNDTIATYAEGNNIQVTDFAQNPTPSQPFLDIGDPTELCSLNSGRDLEGRLLAGLQLFKEQHECLSNLPQVSHAPQTNANQAAQQQQVLPVGPPPAAIASGQFFNRQPRYEMQHFPLSPSATMQGIHSTPPVQVFHNSSDGALTTNSSATPHDQVATGEIERQEYLGVDFGSFIDMTQVEDDAVPGHAAPTGPVNTIEDSNKQHIAVELPVDLSDYNFGNLGLDFSENALGDLDPQFEWHI